MCYSFGSKVIILETKGHHIGSGYVKPDFCVYYFRKTPSTKHEKCNYWIRPLTEIILQATKHLSEQVGKLSAHTTVFKNYQLTPYLIWSTLGWELIISVNHRKGSLRSATKVYHTNYPN